MAYRKGKKPMVDMHRKRSKVKIPMTAGKSIKIMDDTLRKASSIKIKKPNEQMGVHTEQESGQEANDEHMGLVPPGNTYMGNPLCPSNSLSIFPGVHADMLGMDQSIYDFCGNLPLGSINEEGGHLLKDIVNSCMPKKDKIVLNIDDDTDAATNASFKSTQSRSSMVRKMNNMTVRKEDMSMLNSGKRKQGEADDDTASSAMKRLKKMD